MHAEPWQFLNEEGYEIRETTLRGEPERYVISRGTEHGNLISPDKFRDLYKSFARVYTEEDIIAFARRFGLLGMPMEKLIRGNQYCWEDRLTLLNGESVRDWLLEAAQLRIALRIQGAIEDKVKGRALLESLVTVRDSDNFVTIDLSEWYGRPFNLPREQPQRQFRWSTFYPLCSERNLRPGLYARYASKGFNPKLIAWLVPVAFANERLVDIHMRLVWSDKEGGVEVRNQFATLRSAIWWSFVSTITNPTTQSIVECSECHKQFRELRKGTLTCSERCRSARSRRLRKMQENASELGRIEP